MRPDLFRMFYPLSQEAQDRWGETVTLPFPEYSSRVAMEAETFGCFQEEHEEVLAWTGTRGSLELMLFRIPDPGNLDAVRAVESMELSKPGLGRHSIRNSEHFRGSSQSLDRGVGRVLGS